MNNKKSIFEKLITQAQKEESPQVNVADRVIHSLTVDLYQPERFWERPLMWIALASSTAAIPSIVLAVISFNSWTGPLFELKQAIQWVM